MGGLGFGPALDLSGCAFSFDPRLDGCFAEERGPIPCGGAFCPRHACSVFFYPPLEGEKAPMGYLLEIAGTGLVAVLCTPCAARRASPP